MRISLALALVIATSVAIADDEAAPIHEAGGDAKKRYFLIDRPEGTEPPAKGFRLLIVMPGGSGDERFHPFVRSIARHALSEAWIVAQPIAVKWTEDQQIVWPTKESPADGMKFTTEELVDAVVKDVAKKKKIDERFVFTLSWSSSGPAAYAAAFRKKTPVTGSLVAMAVYVPQRLPPIAPAKGRPFYLLHSPDDAVCRIWMARKAKEDLERAGAKATLVEYAGGHGWHGDVFGMIRKGVEWLEAAAGA